MINATSLSAIALLTTATIAAAQHQPPIRPLGPVVVTATEVLGGNVSVRHFTNGVLINDVQNRRLLLLDSTLANAMVVADTTPATANAYSGRAAGLLAFRGDSSLFIDAQSLSMLVIDPMGKVARVMSVPRSQDAMMLGNVVGGASFDGSRIVYRGMSRPQFRGAATPGGAPTPPEMPDSTAVVRVDLATRQVDTVGFTKIPKIKMDVQRDDNGNIRMTSQINPLPVVDDWAVLSDGSIAFVRGRDYHIDWLRPDGSRESSPKIPFDWQRLTDEDKVAFIDSVKAQRERMAAAAPAMGAGGPGAMAGGGGPGGGGMAIVLGGGAVQRREGGPGGPGGGMTRPQMTFVEPSELPDYKPPFFAGQVRADQDGNLWIRTIPTKGIAGGPVYDVINSKGALIDRVQVPKDRTIVGFGAGGVVYLLVREGTTTKLERARFK